MNRFYWALLVLMSAIYLIMLLWSLPHLTALAGGLAMFDLRPGGYTADEARAVLTALSDEGRAFYLDVQQRLDAVFPGLMAVVLVLSYRRLYPPRPALALSLIALGAGLCDYLENAAVAVMLRAGPLGLDPAMAGTASGWTQWKSWLVTVSLIVLLAGLLGAGWRRRRGQAGAGSG